MPAWIKVSQTLFTHEKTFYLGKFLEIPELYVVVHPIALWMYALDHWPDGVLPEDDSLIARAAKWSGPPRPFVEAMITAQFIDDDEYGTRRIHNWDKYAGNLIRKREANAERMRKAREKR